MDNTMVAAAANLLARSKKQNREIAGILTWDWKTVRMHLYTGSSSTRSVDPFCGGRRRSREEMGPNEILVAEFHTHLPLNDSFAPHSYADLYQLMLAGAKGEYNRSCSG